VPWIKRELPILLLTSILFFAATFTTFLFDPLGLQRTIAKSLETSLFLTILCFAMNAFLATPYISGSTKT
jgi:hypothetical protein